MLFVKFKEMRRGSTIGLRIIKQGKKVALVILLQSSRGAKSITRAQFVYLSKLNYREEKLETFKHGKAPGGLLFFRFILINTNDALI